MVGNCSLMFAQAGLLRKNHNGNSMPRAKRVGKVWQEERSGSRKEDR